MPALPADTPGPTSTPPCCALPRSWSEAAAGPEGAARSRRARADPRGRAGRQLSPISPGRRGAGRHRPDARFRGWPSGRTPFVRAVGRSFVPEAPMAVVEQISVWRARKAAEADEPLGAPPFGSRNRPAAAPEAREHRWCGEADRPGRRSDRVSADRAALPLPRRAGRLSGDHGRADARLRLAGDPGPFPGLRGPGTFGRGIRFATRRPRERSRLEQGGELGPIRERLERRLFLPSSTSGEPGLFRRVMALPIPR